MKLIFGRIAASLWIASASAVMCHSATAQTAEFHACMDKADDLGMMHNTARLTCIGAELKIQDATLNAAYRAATSKMTPELKIKMVATQRSWILFRDADCNMEAALNMPLAPSLCLMLKTKDRALELSELLVSLD